MIEKRKEFKFLLSNTEEKYFLANFGNELKVLHPNRLITSLYFDTVDFFLYKNSKLNDTNKMKIRIRAYNNEKVFFKEIKYNDGLGKRKIVNKENIKSFDEATHIFHKDLALIPAVFTSYRRKYFSFEDLRITVDKDIHFYNHKQRTLSKSRVNFQKTIVEFKLGNKTSDIEKYFFKNPEAFSKYQTAISKIYNL
jgi:hypothetical protein